MQFAPPRIFLVLTFFNHRIRIDLTQWILSQNRISKFSSIKKSSIILPIASIEVNLMFSRCIFLHGTPSMFQATVGITSVVATLKLHQFWHRKQTQNDTEKRGQNLISLGRSHSLKKGSRVGVKKRSRIHLTKDTVGNNGFGWPAAAVLSLSFPPYILVNTGKVPSSCASQA